LRSETALVQTVGRAARHVEGQVIMYADKVTDAMQFAIDETNRRREKQVTYNQVHGIVPETIVKEIYDLTDRMRVVAEERGEYQVGRTLPKDELTRLIKELEQQMKQAAEALEFEKAAMLRDQIFDLRQNLAESEDDLPEWERVRRMTAA
jgi:excinuclease ABC subunit B